MPKPSPTPVDVDSILLLVNKWKDHLSGSGPLAGWPEDERFRAWGFREDIDRLRENPQVSKALRSALKDAAIADPTRSESELAEIAIRFLFAACAGNVIAARTHTKWASMGTRSEQLMDLRSARDACREIQGTLKRLAPLIRAGQRLATIESLATDRGARAPDRVDLPLQDVAAHWESALQVLPALEQDFNDLTKLIERQVSRKRQVGGKAETHHAFISELAMEAQQLDAQDGNGRRPPVRLIYETILALRPEAELSEDTVRKRLSV